MSDNQMACKTPYSYWLSKEPLTASVPDVILWVAVITRAQHIVSQVETWRFLMTDMPPGSAGQRLDCGCKACSGGFGQMV